ncbi:MAG: hypothetical protein WC339_06530 [Candidatus Izemoplasmatales bacterium]
MKIYLMHQTHTDIGYTDRQEKITKYHIDYLKQAICISEEITSDPNSPYQGFVWNNESFWIIDTFLKNVDNSWKDRLIKAIQRKHIQVTGNYLNLTELVDYHVLEKYIRKAKDFGELTGVQVTSAISMDINGWGIGYPDVFIENGITRFFTSVHNHHGFVPFRRKHNLFYWETPKGDKLLVYNGDVYNQGNVAKLVPDVIADFTGGYHTKALITDEQLAYSKQWLDDYLESVKMQGYDYDFLPILTKGLLVDNAPPNKHIIESINRFNDIYRDTYEIEMIGINDFFDTLEKMQLDIPTYKGDWTDWWSDGFMSTPKAVSLYKEAQRNYEQILSLQEQGFAFDSAKLDALEYNLMMFSEHTWGYFTSVTEPWNKMTVKLDDRNTLFASLANQYSDILLDDFKEANGEMHKATGRPMRYKVTNPYGESREELVKMYINWWEDFAIKDGFELVDLASEEAIPFQTIRVDQKSRIEVRTSVTLAPYESKVFEIRTKKTKKRLMPLDPLFVRDERYDYVSPYLDNEIHASQFRLESPYLSLTFEPKKGITSFTDKQTGKSLINDDQEYGLFSPIYEVSKVLHKYQFNPDEMAEIRKNIGRNRKLFSSEITEGVLINTKVLASGPLFARVALKYELPGTIYSVVELTVYRYKPQLDVSYIVGKETVWEPESLYLSFPLTYHPDESLWIQKNGGNIRPRIDQLPGTCTQFYTMKNGLAFVSEKGSLILSSLDSPLLYMGTLNAHEILLMNDKEAINIDETYIWLMNNYWETNFNTSLGGFYQYDFSICIYPDATHKEEAIAKIDQLTRRFLISQVKDRE